MGNTAMRAEPHPAVLQNGSPNHDQVVAGSQSVAHEGRARPS